MTKKQTSSCPPQMLNHCIGNHSPSSTNNTRSQRQRQSSLRKVAGSTGNVVNCRCRGRPAAVVDGHISCMGEDFLRYVNEAATHWEVNLGASYGTEYWQLHNDRRQNGVFKSELASSKSRFYMKKRLAGLPAEILPCEILIVVRDAIMNSFMNIQYSQAALLHRGWNPFNCNSMDCAQILITAPETVQKERNSILRSRGITLDASTRNAFYSQQNLLEVGSGRLVGGADAEQRIATTASSLNVSGYAASGLMLSMQENEKKNNARRSHQEIETSKSPSREELIQRYKDSKFFLAGQVFGNGDGRLSTEVPDEVIRRNEARR